MAREPRGVSKLNTYDIHIVHVACIVYNIFVVLALYFVDILLWNDEMIPEVKWLKGQVTQSGHY